MIYYINPNIVNTTGKCSPNIRIYEFNDDMSYTGYTYIYKNRSYFRSSYNPKPDTWYMTRYPVASSLPIGLKRHPPMRFTTRELATAYAITAYQQSYITTERKAHEILANLQKHSTFKLAADEFIDANPEYFI